MIVRMVSLPRCAEICGLLPHELVAGVSPADRHARMLARYRRLSLTAACAQLTADIRLAIGADAFDRAADLLVVLRLALAQTGAERATARRRRSPVRLARMKWLPNIDYFVQEPREREVRTNVVTLDGRIRATVRP